MSDWQMVTNTVITITKSFSASIFFVCVTNWVDVKKDVYYCDTPECYLKHNYIVKQEGYRSTNTVVHIEWEGEKHDITFKCSDFAEFPCMIRDVDYTLGECVKSYPCH